MLLSMTDKVTGKFTFKIPPDWEDKLDEIALLARRKRSETARLLLGRALALYERDGKIDDDLPPITSPKASPGDEPGKKGLNSVN
jgi:hypothetical protein